MKTDTRTEVSLTITLNAEEAKAALHDPGPLQREIKLALGVLGEHSENGHVGRRQKITPKAKMHKRAAGRRRGAARASTTITCPQCGKECNPRGLGVHQARKHGVTGDRLDAKLASG